MGSNSVFDLIFIVVLIVALFIVLKPSRVRPKWKPRSIWDDPEHCKRMQGICDRKVESAAKREAMDMYGQYQSQYTRWLYGGDKVNHMPFLPIVFPSKVHLYSIEIAGPNCIPKYDSDSYKELVKTTYQDMLREFKEEN